MIICAREGCDVEFDQKKHNQKYHNDECCRLATNSRIMEKYYAKQAQRKGKTRYCEDCGITKLSRYNDSQICGPCQARHDEDANDSALAMLMNTAWLT